MDPDRSLRRLSPPRRLAKEAAREAKDKAAAAKPKPKAIPTPRPRLDVPHPTAEEFEVWTKDPVTRFVATAYALGAALNEEAWRQLSWVQADPDPLRLVEFKARADAYNAFLEVGHADYVKTIDLNSKGPRK